MISAENQFDSEFEIDVEDEGPDREKVVSPAQQSSQPLVIEKNNARQRRAEIQNPLMHESY